MSNASPVRQRVTPDTLRASLVRTCRAACFWTAVALPFVILTVVTSDVARQYPALLVGLLAANLVALVLGRDYNR